MKEETIEKIYWGCLMLGLGLGVLGGGLAILAFGISLFQLI